MSEIRFRKDEYLAKLKNSFDEGIKDFLPPSDSSTELKKSLYNFSAHKQEE